MSLLEPSVLTIKARGTEGTGTQVTGTGPLSVGLQPTPQAWRDLTCVSIPRAVLEALVSSLGGLVEVTRVATRQRGRKVAF